MNVRAPQDAGCTQPEAITWLARGLLLAVVAVVGVAILLPNNQLAELRRQWVWLSRMISQTEQLWPVVDMVHVVMFAAVGILVALAFPALRFMRFLLAIAVVACVSELAQVWIPGRTASIGEALLDVAAAFLGLSLVVGARICGRQPWILPATRWLFLAGVALLPLQKWPVARAFGFPLMPSDLLFLGALGARGFACLAGCAPLRVNGFHGWLGAYLAAMLLAAWVLVPASVGAMAVFPAGLLPIVIFDAALAKWIGLAWLVLLAVLACDVASDTRSRLDLLRAWLLGSCVVLAAGWIAIVGFYMCEAGRACVQPLLSHYGSLPVGPYPRINLTFANANMLGNYLLVSLGVALAMRDADRLSMPHLRNFSILLGVPLLATFSPAIGGALLLFALWLWRRPNGSSPLRRAVLCIGLLAAVLNLLALLVNPAAPFTAPSVHTRIWQEAWETWRGHFWRGIGLDQPVVHVEYLAPDGGTQLLTDAHNIVLNLGSQGGLPAVVTFAGLLAWLLWRTRAQRERGLWLAVFLATCYLGVGGSFEDARHVWVLMGLLAAAVATVDERQWVRMGRDAMQSEQVRAADARNVLNGGSNG